MILLVAHNSKLAPFDCTLSIDAPRTDELVTNQLFPSADQLMPESVFECPSEIERAALESSCTRRIRSLASSRSTIATVAPSGDRSHSGEAAGSALSLSNSTALPRTGSMSVSTSSFLIRSRSPRMHRERALAHRTSASGLDCRTCSGAPPEIGTRIKRIDTEAPSVASL